MTKEKSHNKEEGEWKGKRRSSMENYIYTIPRVEFVFSSTNMLQYALLSAHIVCVCLFPQVQHHKINYQHFSFLLHLTFSLAYCRVSALNCYTMWGASLKLKSWSRLIQCSLGCEWWCRMIFKDAVKHWNKTFNKHWSNQQWKNIHETLQHSILIFVVPFNVNAIVRVRRR